jgi:hypothetical protein
MFLFSITMHIYIIHALHQCHQPHTSRSCTGGDSSVAKSHGMGPPLTYNPCMRQMVLRLAASAVVNGMYSHFISQCKAASSSIHDLNNNNNASCTEV